MVKGYSHFYHLGKNDAVTFLSFLLFVFAMSYLMIYNPSHNILELYNVLVQVRVATGKTKLDI